MMGGEEFPCSSQPCLHLVRNHQHVVLGAELSNGRDVVLQVERVHG